MTQGNLIREYRESLGWSRRKLASKFGTSTRRIRAVETDSDPKPRKEQPQHKMVFIPILGYAIHCFTRRPVADRTFDLQQQQGKVLNFVRSYCEV